MVRISRWQVIFVAFVIVLGVLFSFPNLMSKSASDALPRWLPNTQQVNLGLDLQGGCYLLTNVAIDEVFGELRENMVASVRSELRQERLGYANLGVQGEEVVFTLREPASADRIIEFMQMFNMPSGLEAVGYNRDDIPALVEGTLPQHRVTKLSPVPAGADELSAMFDDAMRYW